jgi:hypothetical protein
MRTLSQHTTPIAAARSAPIPTVGSSILDELLYYACEALQLTPTLYTEAETHYRAAANWIGREDSWFYNYDPDIFPQGSFRIGTTTKPIFRNEFDLDFVLQLAMGLRIDPLRLLDELEKRLRANKTYAPMVERLNRCVRLNYANRFHLDILPAVPDGAGTRVAVPDRKLAGWKSSDPKGYAAWFESRCVQREARMDKAAQIEPLRPFATAAQKVVLQQVVQLSKRCRDRYPVFVKDCKLSPRSIVFTTLAAESYRGSDSAAVAIYGVLHTLRAQFASSTTPIEVWNPVNSLELLSEQWDTNLEAYAQYGRWLDSFASDWDKLLAAKTVPDIQRQLAALFGDGIAHDAIIKHASRTDDLRKAGDLKVSNAGVLMTGSGAAAAVRPNTFYGDEG